MPSAGPQRTGLLVFVHVPKTAGTTLRAILAANEPAPRSRGLGNVFKGGGGISTALIERLRNGGLELENVRLLRGHVPLGIRQYLPNSLPAGKRVTYFTFLRDPVERTLSHYFRVREGGTGHGLPPLPADATLDDMLAGGYLHDNLHTRMLSGQPEPFGEVTGEMLEQAKRNLRDELVFFGLTERFDESLVLARRRLGLRTILYRTSRRVNASRPRGDQIPAELAEAAERCNRYDRELYEYAEKLFDAVPERGELDFQVELAALRAAKARGQISVDAAPPPERFRGDDVAWRMLLEAKAELLRMEFELARRATLRTRAATSARRTSPGETRAKTKPERAKAARAERGPAAEADDSATADRPSPKRRSKREKRAKSETGRTRAKAGSGPVPKAGADG